VAAIYDYREKTSCMYQQLLYYLVSCYPANYYIAYSLEYID